MPCSPNMATAVCKKLIVNSRVPPKPVIFSQLGIFVDAKLVVRQKDPHPKSFPCAAIFPENGPRFNFGQRGITTLYQRHANANLMPIIEKPRKICEYWRIVCPGKPQVAVLIRMLDIIQKNIDVGRDPADDIVAGKAASFHGCMDSGRTAGLEQVKGRSRLGKRLPASPG